MAEPKITKEIQAFIQGHFEAANYSFQEADYLIYEKNIDYLADFIAHIKGVHIKPFRKRASAVVWPKKVEEIALILQFANEHNIPITVCGGGTQFGEIIPLNGGIILDMKRMSKILKLDKFSNIAQVEAGIINEHLEIALAREGYHLGYFKTEDQNGTLGGFLSAKKRLVFDNFFEGIENQCLNINGVLPDGSICSSPISPRRATGPNFDHMFIGGGGQFGIIVSATLKIFKDPLFTEFLAIEFDSVEAPINLLRLTLQKGFTPAISQIFDTAPFQKAISKKRFVLILIFAGYRERTVKLCSQIYREGAKKQAGVFLDPEIAKRHWKRYAVNRPSETGVESNLPPNLYKRFDVYVPYSDILALYHDIEAVESKAFRLNLMLRHFYTHGVILHVDLLRSNIMDFSDYIDILKRLFKRLFKYRVTCRSHIEIDLLGPAFFKSDETLCRSHLEIKKGLDPKMILNSGKIELLTRMEEETVNIESGAP